MATHYSIISALIRPEIQEKISVGLLMFDSEGVFFDYSKAKIKVFKGLMSANSVRILKDVLKSIEDRINKDSFSFAPQGSLSISTSISCSREVFSKEYFDYLNRYSNNTLSFSQPKEIGLPFTNEAFELLFNKFIDHSNESAIVNEKVKTIDIITNKFKERITAHYNVGREVTPSEIENLIAPVKIDFMGRNSIDVYVQTLDLEQSSNFILNDLGALLQVKKAYELNEINMQDFIVAKEPPKKFTKQHSMWEHLRNSKMFEYVDIDDSERIVQYAEEHGVLPLFPEVNN